MGTRHLVFSPTSDGGRRLQTELLAQAEETKAEEKKVSIKRHTDFILPA